MIEDKPQGVKPVSQVIREAGELAAYYTSLGDMPVDPGSRLAFARAVLDLAVFASTCRDDFDCDPDAHRYGTFCRACEAERLIGSATPRDESSRTAGR